MVGKRLQKAWELSGLQPEEFAIKIGASYSNLGRLFKRESIESKYIFATCALLDLPLEFFAKDDFDESLIKPQNNSVSEEMDSIVENLQKMVGVLEAEVVELKKDKVELKQDKEDLRKDKDRVFDMLQQALQLREGMVGKDEASDAGHSSLATTAKVIKLEKEEQPMRKTG